MYLASNGTMQSMSVYNNDQKKQKMVLGGSFCNFLNVTNEN